MRGRVEPGRVAKRGVQLTAVAMLAASSGTAWSAATGPSSMPSTSSSSSQSQTPEQKARSVFNSGVRDVNKADKYEAAAEKATDAKRKGKALEEQQKELTDARGKFEQVVELDSHMPEAWNYLGYTRRKLGDYDGALQAYDRALKLKPSFAEAIEYRGEAYLRMKRFDDAKQAYLDLFAGDRKLADKLLGSMKSWLQAQTTSGEATVEDFAKWIQERSQIAAQTASLTREGAGSSWR